MKKSSFAKKLLSGALSLTLATAMVPSMAFAQANAGNVVSVEPVQAQTMQADAQQLIPGNYTVDLSINKADGTVFGMAKILNTAGETGKADVIVYDDGTAYVYYKLSGTSYDGFIFANIADCPEATDDLETSHSDAVVFYEYETKKYSFSDELDFSKLGTSANIILHNSKYNSNAGGWYSKVQLSLVYGAKLTPVASEAAKAIIDGIDALPAAADITVDYADTVRNLRKSYNRASEFDRSCVTNISKLADVEAALAALGAYDLSEEVVNAIFKLAGVSFGSFAVTVQDAVDAYAALPAAQKELVYNYSWLQAAQAISAFDADYRAKAEELVANLSAALSVVEGIASLQESFSLDELLAVQSDYSALEDSEEAFVCNADVLAQLAADHAVVAEAGYYAFGKTISQGSKTVSVELVPTYEGDNLMFYVTDAMLKVDAEGNMVAEIVLSSTGQTKVYMGSKAQAAGAVAAGGEGVIDGVSCTNSDEKAAYKFEIPVSSLDQVIRVASYSSKGSWYDRALVFASGNMTQVVDPDTQAVIDAINAFGETPTIAQVEAAVKAFNKLGDGQMALVSEAVGDALENGIESNKQSISWSDCEKTMAYSDNALLFAMPSVEGAKTTLSYRKAAGDSCLTVDAKTGKVKVAGGTLPGDYSITITATAAATDCVHKATTSATMKVHVNAKAQNLSFLRVHPAVNYNGSLSKTCYPISQVVGAKGTVTYAKVSGSPYLTISGVGLTTGRVTVAKGTPVGEYSITIRVTSSASENGAYAATSKDVVCKVKVARVAPTITVTGKVVRAVNFSSTKDKTVACPITSIQCASKPMTYELDNVKNASGFGVTKKFKVNPITGAVTVAKGTQKDTYTISMKITSAETTNYKSNWRIVTCTVKVV